ncbi:hypothetical protein Tco_0131836 [Tanacetum coccineum]
MLQDHVVVDSDCYSHMTGNKAYLSDYEDFNGGFVAFGSDPKRGPKSGGCDQFGSTVATALICLSRKYLALTLTKKLFANMKKGYAGDIIPLLPAMLAGAAMDQGEGSAQPAEPHPTPIDLLPSISLPPIPSPPLPPHSPPHSSHQS